MKQRISGFLKLSILFLSLTYLNSSLAQSSGGTMASHFYFEETFFPVFVSKNDAVNPAGGSTNSSPGTESGIGYDMRTTFGYVFDNILVGLTYNMYSLDTNRPRSSDLEGLKTKTTKSEFGPTFGYYFGNWRVALTYFMMATKSYSDQLTDITTGAVSVDETYKNTGGTGFQFGVGYDFHFGSGFGISPTLIYRSVTYSKQSYSVATGSNTPYASTTLQTKAIDSELKPMITLSYSF